MSTDNIQRSAEKILTFVMSQFDDMDVETLRILIDSDTDTKISELLNIMQDEVQILRSLVTGMRKSPENEIEKLVRRVGDDLSQISKLNHDELFLLSYYDTDFLANEWRVSMDAMREFQNKMLCLAQHNLIDDENKCARHAKS